MQLPVLFLAWSTALLAVASAENFTVLVGNNQGLTFTPESVTAKVGDTVAFIFLSKNHSVTQSTFAEPCKPMISPVRGVDSGFQPVPNGATAFPVWSFTLEDDRTPFWFHCAQVPHCSNGMVFAVNPTPDKTFATFKGAAMGTVSPSSTSPASSASEPRATVNNAHPVAGNHVRLVYPTIFAFVVGLVL